MQDIFLSGKPTGMETTSTEGRILAVLEEDAKASYAQIADRADVSKPGSGSRPARAGEPAGVHDRPAHRHADVMSGRIAVVTKSPLTGTVTDSHHGGWSGARLKWSGFDGLLFTGKAERPSYAVVEDGELTLHDAEHLWGKGVHETIEELEGEVDGSLGKNLSIMAIGPGGENEVKYGCIVNEDDRASGRGGTGAVMGSRTSRPSSSSRTDPREKLTQDELAKVNKQAMRISDRSDRAR